MTTATASAAGRPGTDTAGGHDGAVRLWRAEPEEARTRSGPTGQGLGSGVVQVVLVLIGIFWLVPTIGLLVSSLRSAADNASSGWWKVFTAPSQLTIDNYQRLLDDPTVLTLGPKALEMPE